MKNFLTKNPIANILVVLLIILSLFSINQIILKNKIKEELFIVQNKLSESIGTIEIEQGIYSRLASEHGNLNRNYENLLGENELLSETINQKEEQIRTLLQTSATLREQIEFSGNARTTVIAGCNENFNQNTESNPGETTNTESIIEDGQFVPNLRVEFDFEKDGFRIEGFTESNPSLTLGHPVGVAQVSLTQINPFVIDAILTEDNENDWRLVIYEQQQRLEFEVGVLSVNPRTSKIKWYERIGFGSQVVATNNGLGLSPVLGARIGERGAWGVTAGPHWLIGRNGIERGLSAGFVWYPFSRRRSR